MQSSQEQHDPNRVPSEHFFIITFSLIGILILIGMMISLTFIISIRLHKSLQNVSSLLSCNSCFVGLFYFLFHIFYIFWAFYPLPTYRENSYLCQIIGYLYSVTCCGISWSHAVLATNRLCYSLLSRHRWLLTYRFAWRLISAHWILTFVLPFPFLFFNAYQYQPESRICILTTRQTSTSIMGVILFYNIPLTMMGIVYVLIWSHGRRNNQMRFSTRTRDFAIMRHILTLVLIDIICGHPYMTLIILDYFNRATKEWYIFGSFFITLSVTANMCAIFIFHRKLRRMLCTRVTCLRQPSSTTSKSTSEGVAKRSPIPSAIDGTVSIDTTRIRSKYELQTIQESNL